jgi:hypothetical protein
MISDDGRPCLSEVGLNACLVKVVWSDRKPVPPSWMFKSPEDLSFVGEHTSFMTTQAMYVYALGATIYSVCPYVSSLNYTTLMYNSSHIGRYARQHYLCLPKQRAVGLRR